MTNRVNFYDLRKEIVSYLDGDSSFQSLEDLLSKMAARDEVNMKDMLNSLYHALQHYDLDVQSMDCSSEEFEVMRGKMGCIADALLDDDSSVFNEAVKDFFNNPYAD